MARVYLSKETNTYTVQPCLITENKWAWSSNITKLPQIKIVVKCTHKQKAQKC